MHPFTRERLDQEAAFAKAEEEERAREAAEAAKAAKAAEAVAALKAAMAARGAAPQTAPTASATEVLSAAELRERRLAYFDAKAAAQRPKRRRGMRELKSLETTASIAPSRRARLRNA